MKRSFSIHKKMLTLGLFAGLLLFGFTAFSTYVFGQDTFGTDSINTNIALGGADIRVIIVKIINVALGLLGIVALGIVLYGGYMYMTAGGNEERVNTAKKILINGTIGLVIILSSFAITKFLLDKLGAATCVGGSCATPSTTLVGDCFAQGTPYYITYKDTLTCKNLCQLYPTDCCLAEHFVVESITPHTPITTDTGLTGLDTSMDTTGLYNDTIRVLFSKPVAGSANDMFTITYTEDQYSADITNDFIFSSKEGGRLIEAQYKKEKSFLCTNLPNATHCLLPGEYRIFVSSTVMDTSGTMLETEVDCGTFPKDAAFKIQAITNLDAYLDTTDPKLSSLFINTYGPGAAIKLVEGETYAITTGLYDRFFKNTDGIFYGGNALINFTIYKEGQSSRPIKNAIHGPPVSLGSSSKFDFLAPFTVPSNLEYQKNYIIEATGHDIDGNKTSTTTMFQVIPISCENGQLDSGEVTVDTGGVCGNADGESCTLQSDCSQWSKCLNPQTSNTLCKLGETTCVCTAYPYIKNVEYMNGAEGNWITITGYNFGSATGSVYLNYDRNNDGDYVDVTDIKTPAIFPQCNYGKTWNSSWIIVEVPRSAHSTIKPAISVVASSTGFADFTNDSFGPIIGNYDEDGTLKTPKPDGLFEYNDIQRPGLCSVTVFPEKKIVLPDKDKTEIIFQQGTSFAPPDTSIIAEGKGFGASAGSAGKITFESGGKNSVSLDAFVGSWSGNAINSVVPFAKSGKNAVYVTASSGKKSNPAMFEVVDLSQLLIPIITEIDPTTTTPGSYITIYGSNFGSGGKIFLESGSSVLETAPLPSYCTQTWKDTQIIAKIPFNANIGIKNVVVERNDSVKSTGNHPIEIDSGPPKPSICTITPSAGPAPLKSGFLTLLGDNFTIDVSSYDKVFFWSQKAQADDVNTWLKGSEDSGIISSVNINTIQTKIPFDNIEGFSMITGPIKVKNTNGDVSNGVTYTVTDCREPGTGEIPGFQCCQEGDEAGQLKPNGFMCKGASREAGYVWRFTTGKIPDDFYVLEQCDMLANPTVYPSPSPWADRPEGLGNASCVNALITTKFSLPVKQDTIITTGVQINDANVRIFTCGQGEQSDCNGDNLLDVTANFEVNSNGAAFNFQPLNKANLQEKTWYAVAFSSGVESLQNLIILGENVPTSESLLKTNPCTIDGFDGAFCFEFKTGAADNICTLVGAMIEPSTWTTSLLGVIQNPSYGFMYELASIFNQDDPNIKPQFFDIHGIANQECTLMNVDGKGWDWGPDEEPPANPLEAASGHVFADVSHTDSRGIAKAWKNNPTGSDIFATVFESSSDSSEGKEITATSTIIVNLGNPKVILPKSARSSIRL
ncbi:MAG: hypothetical protein HYV41_01250 [Candidatus Magasanikbacteria bacterium]|nr:hypothetical protein [Candidatus Magasanikbacteria bacterium]